MARENDNDLMDRCILAAIDELPADQRTRDGVAEKAAQKFMDRKAVHGPQSSVVNSAYGRIVDLESAGRIEERRLYVVLRYD
jgi:hypothetical protein